MLEGHGWGGSRDTDENSASSEQTGNVGLGPLRKAGFNVLTWDSRGFGNSGGTVTVDAPDAEARDVEALIDWLAQQPEAAHVTGCAATLRFEPLLLGYLRDDLVRAAAKRDECTRQRQHPVALRGRGFEEPGQDRHAPG